MPIDKTKSHTDLFILKVDGTDESVVNIDQYYYSSAVMHKDARTRGLVF